MAESVSTEGIFADGSGAILLFTDMRVANAIARDQLRANRYAVFEVEPAGLVVPPRRDRGRAPVCRYRRLVRQAWVEPKYVKLLGTYDTTWDRPTDWDREVASKLGIGGPLLDAIFEAREWARHEIAKGVLTERQIAAELARRLQAAARKQSRNRTPTAGQ